MCAMRELITGTDHNRHEACDETHVRLQQTQSLPMQLQQCSSSAASNCGHPGFCIICTYPSCPWSAQLTVLRLGTGWNWNLRFGLTHSFRFWLHEARGPCLQWLQIWPHRLGFIEVVNQPDRVWIQPHRRTSIDPARPQAGRWYCPRGFGAPASASASA